MDLSEFLPEFLAEAQIRLEQMEQILSAMLAGDPSPPAGMGADRPAPLSSDPLDQLFRVAHSVKGTVSFLYLPPINGLANRMEELLQRMKRGEVAAAAGDDTVRLRLLMEGVAALQTMLSVAARGEEPEPLPDLEKRLETV
jgi:chemotaxis protein histidine kinase CheA